MILSRQIAKTHTSYSLIKHYSTITPAQKQVLERMLRVDHAGELGANYIYKGQLAVVSDPDSKNQIQHVCISGSVLMTDVGPGSSSFEPI